MYASAEHMFSHKVRLESMISYCTAASANFFGGAYGRAGRTGSRLNFLPARHADFGRFVLCKVLHGIADHASCAPSRVITAEHAPKRALQKCRGQCVIDEHPQH